MDTSSIPRRGQRTTSDYELLAKQHSIIWLGPEVPTTKHQTNWHCSCGNDWATSYANIRSGTNCPVCARKRISEWASKTRKESSHNAKQRKQPSDYHALARSFGFLWVEEPIKSTHAKTQWQCQFGHTWETTFSEISRGRGCPYCSNQVEKTEADYLERANQKNLNLIGAVPKTAHDKTRWRCKMCGYEYDTSYHNLSYRKGCPKCSGLMRKTEQDYHNLAEQHRLKWVGTLPRNIGAKTTWECGKGHRFEMAYASVYMGQNCPKCRNFVNGAQASKPQLELFALLGGELNYLVKPYHIDIALLEDTAKIAVEFDSWYYHTLRGHDDTKRDRYLMDHGWSILRIKSGTLIPPLEEINVAIDKLRSGRRYAEIVTKEWRPLPTN